MRSPMLLATLLCVLLAAEAHADAKAVKLCGRSFLRAVVYACGGSRWRRVTAAEEAPQSSELQGHRHPGTTGAPTMDRQWRDQRQALMSVCCSLGCEMSDLFMLC